MEITPAGLSCVQINESQKGFSVGKSPRLENHIQVQCQIRYYCFKIQARWIESSGILQLLYNKRTSYFVRQPSKRKPYLCMFEYPIATVR